MYAVYVYCTYNVRRYKTLTPTVYLEQWRVYLHSCNDLFSNASFDSFHESIALIRWSLKHVCQLCSHGTPPPSQLLIVVLSKWIVSKAIRVKSFYSSLLCYSNRIINTVSCCKLEAIKKPINFHYRNFDWHLWNAWYRNSRVESWSLVSIILLLSSNGTKCKKFSWDTLVCK